LLQADRHVKLTIVLRNLENEPKIRSRKLRLRSQTPRKVAQ